MKPTLLVLAAGMGSRYGGLKQLDGVGPSGETIMDYSVYDAMQAGFGRVVFVIRHDFEDEFRKVVLSKYENSIPVDVVFQSVDALPEGYTVPEGREKPWGTNHAILMSADKINEPFAVINADDFYSREAFRVLARELSREDRKPGEYCMVGFRVGNTMTENGSVSRGVCSTDNGILTKIVERRAISYDDNHDITFIDETDNSVHELDPQTHVSMNFWGLTPDYFDYSKREFLRFLDKYIDKPKSEFFIPSVVDKLIRNGEASVQVLDTDARWFGVTYPQDRQTVVDKLAALHADGTYPERLFSKI